MQWPLNKIKDKFKLLSYKNIKTMFKEHGLALVVIVVGWELIEHIVFPLIFALLGSFVNPMWYAGIPASLFICLHWFAVPLLWSLWIRIARKEPEDIVNVCCGE